jgi:hypothetical protein
MSARWRRRSARSRGRSCAALDRALSGCTSSSRVVNW